MDSERVAAIRQALEQATPGEWKWHSVLAPYEIPESVISAGDLRVETPTPDEAWDSRIEFVVEAMKSGHVLMRKADADLIANAPAYLRDLLTELDRLQAIADAARVFLTADVYKALSDRQMEWAEDQDDVDRLTALRDVLAAYDAT